MRKTEQLKQWRGKFGDDYLERNRVSAEVISGRAQFFKAILGRIDGLTATFSLLEIGASNGINLLAIRSISEAKLLAIEPNQRALTELRRNLQLSLGPANAYLGDVFDLPLEDASVDLVFTCGVLIHIRPEGLRRACAEIVRTTKRYILCMEYFSARPEKIIYQGQRGLLFKRDFGSYYLDNFAQLAILDYGFLWKRLSAFDNVTWWLFEKCAEKGSIESEGR